MKTLTCYCGKDILMSDRVFDEAKKYSWSCGGGTVSTSLWDGNKAVYLAFASLVKGIYPGYQYEHKNGDAHDNQDDNIRCATDTQNKWNRGKQKNNTSGYKGVSFNTKGKYLPWRMKINANGKQYTSFHATPELAALAYNEMAKKLHGEFAKLNDVI